VYISYSKYRKLGSFGMPCRRQAPKGWDEWRARQMQASEWR